MAQRHVFTFDYVELMLALRQVMHVSEASHGLSIAIVLAGLRTNGEVHARTTRYNVAYLLTQQEIHTPFVSHCE